MLESNDTFNKKLTRYPAYWLAQCFTLWEYGFLGFALGKAIHLGDPFHHVTLTGMSYLYYFTEHAHRDKLSMNPNIL